MAKTAYNYGALSTGFSFSNGDTTNAALVGATQAIVSNGALTIDATDVPAGFSKWLIGTSQGTSGTSYLTHTVAGTKTFSFSVFWRLDALGTIGAGPIWVGAGSTRIMAFSILSTEQIRFFNAAGGTIFTSTISGGAAADQTYRTDFHVTVGTTTSNSRIVSETYLGAEGTTPISGTVYDSGATLNLGTADATTFRHGTRTGTGTADENIKVAVVYDPASAYLIGPPSTSYDVFPADSIGVTDTGATQQIDYGWSSPDAAGVTDTVTRVLSAARTPADGVGITDSVIATMGLVAGATDTVGLTDVATAQLSLTRSPGDQLGVTDSAGAQQVNTRAPADAAGVADSAVTQQQLTRDLIDSVGLLDIGAPQMGAARSGSDGAGVSDQVTTILTLVRTPADPVSVTDQVSISFERVVSDVVAVTDAIGNEGAKGASDTAGVTDSVTALLTMQRQAADEVAIADGVTTHLSLVRPAADAIGILDEAVKLTTLPRSAPDTAGVADQVSVQLSAGRIAADGAGVTDMVTVTRVINVFVADGIGATDAAYRERTRGELRTHLSMRPGPRTPLTFS